MKEIEAKTKYCPLKPLNQNVSNSCIASDCMMWVESDNEATPSNNEQDEVIYYPDGDCGLKIK